MSVILVHGGVETSDAPSYIKVLQEAALAGFRALGTGHLDAAEEAVKVLEKSPLLNAGYGSVLNLDGEVEMDASVMDGATGRFGAVAAIREVAHPVSVARRVLEDTPHVFLVGQGATKFARSRGFPQADCVAPEMLQAWQKAIALKDQGSLPAVSLFTGLPAENRQACDTVGCAVSHQGRTAAASSTGGSFLKLPGRVGDTPVIGGGIYASQRCAVVCTGLGEAFIETLTAKYVDSLLAHGLHPQEAAEKAMARLVDKKGAAGGLLVVDSQNRYGAACNTRTFPVVLLIDGKIVDDFKPGKLKG
ncbi:MAG: isoaspartyl peptidase/L-asparaginase family protein [Bacillota bacterium]